MDFFTRLNKASYDELWTLAVHHVGLPNTQINSINQKSYIATLILENTPEHDRPRILSALRSMKAQKANFRRERRLLFPHNGGR